MKNLRHKPSSERQIFCRIEHLIAGGCHGKQSKAARTSNPSDADRFSARSACYQRSLLTSWA